MRLARAIAPFIPYVAVLIGLYVLRSAWAAILLYHVGIVTVLAAGSSFRLVRVVRSGWRTGPAIVLGLAGALAGVTLWLVWPIARLPGLDLADALARYELVGAMWVAFAIYFSAVHPVLEEVYWRYYLAPRTTNLHWTDIAFAGYHVLVLNLFLKPMWIAVAFVTLVSAAWVWRVTANRLGGLGVPAISHTVADASIVIAATIMMG